MFTELYDNEVFLVLFLRTNLSRKTVKFEPQAKLVTLLCL